jgi:hypothetical protein
MTNTNWDLGERIERLVQEHIAASRKTAQEAIERAFAVAAGKPAVTVCTERCARSRARRCACSRRWLAHRRVSFTGR